MKKHLTVLKEGEAVSINTFQSKDYLGEFRTNPYPYKITFFRTTKVKAADDFLEYYPEKYYRTGRHNEYELENTRMNIMKTQMTQKYLKT